MWIDLLNGRVGPRWAVGLTLILTLAGLSLLQFTVTVRDGTAFGCGFGGDFVAFLAGAHLLASRGNFYDFHAQGLAQQQILAAADAECYHPTTPLEYLAVFIVPLLPLVPLPPIAAFLAWTAVNIALIAFALWRLAKATRLSTIVLWLWGAGYLPIVFGLGLGQFTGFLLLTMTEAYIALKEGRERRAGLWLSLLMVKPQFLSLFLILFVWKKRQALLLSFGSSALVLTALSIVLVGPAAVSGWLRIISDYAHLGENPSVPQVMANWRAVSMYAVGSLGPPAVLSGLVLLSSLTVLAALAPWRGERWGQMSRENFDLRLLGLMAAALLVGYFTHLPSLVLVVPPAVFVAAHAIRGVDRPPLLLSGVLDLIAFGPSVLFQTGAILLPSLHGAYQVAGLGTAAILCILVVLVAFGKLAWPEPRRLQEESPQLT